MVGANESVVFRITIYSSCNFIKNERNLNLKKEF